MSPSIFDPSDEEAQEARTGIHFHQGEIASLDAKIASLLGTVDTLRQLKAEHQDQLRQCESVLTLARRLPPELLGQIFERCVDVQPSAPIVLSHVCAAWRIAAYSSPRIWSRLFIDCSRPRAAWKVSHWIYMSGGHIPLQITLLPHDTSLLSVMHALLPHTARWQKFTVDAVLLLHAREILDIIRTNGCSFSIMEAIDFIIHEENEGTLDLRQAFTDTKAPRLYSVGLHIYSRSIASLPTQIAVLNLVVPELWLPPQILPQTIQLLRGLPAMQSFSLEFPDGSWPRETLESIEEDVTLDMPDLHTIKLTGCHSLFEILAHLTLPSLCHLGLYETGREFPQNASIGPSLLRMIERSFPPVQTLELYDVDATNNEFIRCFTLLPTLERLFLHGSEMTDVVFRRLCTPSPNTESTYALPSWILPQLTRLDLRWCSQISGKTVVELVQTRLAARQTAPISVVVLINCSSVKEEDVLAVAALTVCRLKDHIGDFCHHRGCCVNNRYRHRFMLRHPGELRQERNGNGRLEL